MAVNRKSKEYQNARSQGQRAASAGQPRARGWGALRSDNNNRGYVEGYDAQSRQKKKR